MSGARIERRTVLGGAALLMGAPAMAMAGGAKPRVAIRTSHGTIVVELEARKAPLTAANFLHYVDAGKYDGGSFFRAARTPGAPKEGTIVGQAAPKQRPFPPIAHESTTQTGLKHVEGTISLGRFAPGSATDGFFICASVEPYLDAHPGAPGDNLGFAAFGQTVQGLAVVHKILSLPTSAKAPFPDQRGQWLKPPVPILAMRRVA
jgi:peptidyl-prolyl cis-trans isomerase A (cyclophilin A)